MRKLLLTLCLLASLIGFTAYADIVAIHVNGVLHRILVVNSGEAPKVYQIKNAAQWNTFTNGFSTLISNVSTN